MDEFMLEFAQSKGYDSWSEMYQKLNGCELHQMYRQCFQYYISKLSQHDVSSALPMSEIVDCGKDGRFKLCNVCGNAKRQ